MNARRDVADELRDTFVAELEERLVSMNDALLALERPVTPAARRRLVESLLRDAHSLKGAAQLVERPDVADLTHALEAYLIGLRDGGSVADGLGPVFDAVDLIDRMRRDDPPAPDVVAVVADRLDPMRVSPPDGERPDGERPDGGGVMDQVALGLDAPMHTDPPEAVAADAGPPPPVVAAAPRGPEAPGRGAERAAVVRIAVDRLDRLLGRAGDLIMLRDASRLRRMRMRALADEVTAWHDEWAALRFGARQAARSRETSHATVRGLHDAIERTAQRADELARRVRAAAGEAHVSDQRLGQVADQLEAEVQDLRMVPVSTLFRTYPRMVRDLAAELGKRVDLVAVGWDTAIDRDLLERLREPLLHLLRNAVDHGIEAPDVRRARGKPESGAVTLEAAVRGSSIVIEVRDDGGGVDLQRVRESAGVAVNPAPDAPEEDALRLVFTPGLTTVTQASPVSGRGVGLDVVRTTVTRVRGTVELASEPGAGTRFTLRLPLSLASTRVLVVAIGEHQFGLSVAEVDRVIRVRHEDIRTVAGRRCIQLTDAPIPLVELADVLGLEPGDTQVSARPTVLLSGAGGRVATFVDWVVGEREVMVKDLGGALGRLPLVQGAAIVDGDRALLVLDVAGVARSVDGTREAALPRSAGRRAASEAERPLRVLVVDDSITTRTLEKNILAAAGFDVSLAADGHEAIRLLSLEPVDVVISDVDMPGLDGIGLTERIRADANLRDIPVILVTGKERPEDRERGLHAGADRYVAKSQFDHQALIGAIRELVG